MRETVTWAGLGRKTEMTGKVRMCSLMDLEPGTEYAVRVRCCAERRQWGSGARKPF